MRTYCWYHLGSETSVYYPLALYLLVLLDSEAAVACYWVHVSQLNNIF